MRTYLRTWIGTIVTDKNANYIGSLTLGCDLFREGGFHQNEQVQVENKSNGRVFTTYVVEGGDGAILNGAAARLGEIGDVIKVIAWEVK